MLKTCDLTLVEEQVANFNGAFGGRNAFGSSKNRKDIVMYASRHPAGRVSGGVHHDVLPVLGAPERVPPAEGAVEVGHLLLHEGEVARLEQSPDLDKIRYLIYLISIRTSRRTRSASVSPPPAVAPTPPCIDSVMKACKALSPT